MVKKPIEELVDVIKGHIDESKLSIGSDRLHITVTDEVDMKDSRKNSSYVRQCQSKSREAYIT